MKADLVGLNLHVDLASRSDASILITGPVGAGKTRLARKIHDRSSRAGKPFIRVKLGGLEEGSFESRVFVYNKGEMAGAHRWMGECLEAADGGTLFLDEIENLPLRLQSRLLELLQTRCVSPVSRDHSISVDVRVIAASNRNLPALVRANYFREDLLRRLSAISLEIPALCERSDDFDELVHDCLAEVSKSHGVSIHRISNEVAQSLEAYHWPGNIRELRRVLEYAAISATGTEIRFPDLPKSFHEKLEASLQLRSLDQAPILAENFENAVGPDARELVANFEGEFAIGDFRTQSVRMNQAAGSLA